MTLSGPLVDVDSGQGANSWSLQLNTYQPFGFKPALSQYVIAYEGGLLFAEDYFVGSNDAILLNQVSNSQFVPVADFISGASFIIRLNTNATGNVLSASYSFTSAAGVTLWSTTLTTSNNALAAPIVGWQMNLIGLGAGSTATFSQASGTFAYSPSGPISWTGIFPGNETYVQYKGIPGSIEKSNIAYDVPFQNGPSVITQTFGISQVVTTSSTTSISSSSISTTSSSQSSISTSQTSTSTSSSQTIIGLNSTILPVLKPFDPAKIQGYFGADIGPMSWTTSLQGFTWNATKGQSLTLGAPVGNTIAQTFFNSTTTAFSFPSLNVFFKPDKYQTNIVLKGTGTGLPVCLPLIPSGGVIEYNQTSKPSHANLGPNEFDWSDIPASMLPTFDGVNLCYTPPVGPYTIDPLALDGSGKCSADGPNTCTISLTTSNANDIIIVTTTESSGGASGCSDFSLASGGGLTWHNRTCKYNTQFVSVSEDYAVAASALSSATLTCTISVALSKLSCNAFGISGADTSTIFDSNGAVPCTGSSTSGGTSASCSISTSNANTFIFGMSANQGDTGGNPTAGTGFTLIQGAHDGRGSASSDYKIVSVTQSGLSCAITLAASANWAFICDAIIQAASTVTQGIKITTLPVGATSATITITGCSPSNSTFTANGNTHTYTLTASCSVSLANPTPGAHTRYCWNISPHTTCSTGTITFTTCASGTCSTYSNNTYYQQSENFTATPQTPTTWDAVYAWHLNGTFLGTAYSDVDDCTLTTSGGGVVSCQQGSNLQFFDYNTKVCTSTPIGNSWAAQGTRCFTDSTSNNVHNVNYVQSTGGGSNGVTNGYGYLAVFLIVPVGLILIGISRRRTN